jgi:hypothetical protein
MSHCECYICKPYFTARQDYFDLYGNQPTYFTDPFLINKISHLCVSDLDIDADPKLLTEQYRMELCREVISERYPYLIYKGVIDFDDPYTTLSVNSNTSLYDIKMKVEKLILNSSPSETEKITKAFERIRSDRWGLNCILRVRYRHAFVKNNRMKFNLYDVLRIEKTASQEEIDNAYKIYISNENSDDKLLEINLAHMVLSHPDKRQAYERMMGKTYFELVNESLNEIVQQYDEPTQFYTPKDSDIFICRDIGSADGNKCPSSCEPKKSYYFKQEERINQDVGLSEYLFNMKVELIKLLHIESSLNYDKNYIEAFNEIKVINNLESMTFNLPHTKTELREAILDCQKRIEHLKQQPFGLLKTTGCYIQGCENNALIKNIIADSIKVYRIQNAPDFESFCEHHMDDEYKKLIRFNPEYYMTLPPESQEILNCLSSCTYLNVMYYKPNFDVPDSANISNDPDVNIMTYKPKYDVPDVVEIPNVPDVIEIPNVPEVQDVPQSQDTQSMWSWVTSRWF